MNIIEVVITCVIGIWQIYIAKKMKDFEKRQDERDELRRKENVFAEATRFIQKYNQNSYESEILLLPYCVAAYKYNPTFPYHREIYRAFCSLTEETQNEILKRQGISLISRKCKNYYPDLLSIIRNNNKIRYPNDSDESFFYDGAKYLQMSIISHGNERVPDALRCPIDTDEAMSRKSKIGGMIMNETHDMDFEQHLTNLLAFHKNETPLSDLLQRFQECNKVEASYICCLISKYTAIYNYNDSNIKNNETLEL